jgi:hypothetical protein
MAISVFPAPSTGGGQATITVTAATALTRNESTTNFITGVYRITCIASTIATVYFFTGSTYIGQAVTVSGTVDINLGTPATKIIFITDTGTDIGITLTFIAAVLSSGTAAGTLDTITTSTTYTQTGGYFGVIVGGGGAGRSGSTNSGGGSGGSGGLKNVDVPRTLTGSMSIVIGAGGTASGASGGTTTFDGFTCTGGSSSELGPYGGSSTGGSPNGVGSPQYGNGNSTIHGVAIVNYGTTGSGGSGNNGYDQLTNGGGSGIGTGGGGRPNGTATAATGYGAGGGGGSTFSAGTPGVVYIFRY